ncbi:hypothetical protein C8R43DRAFT_1038972 [Mycena crocata]|nr:hypothetical protein C8R43DRAFT_1038972 [Mycena crocata]
MLWLLFCPLFLCFHSSFAALVTTIIDDAFAGDAQSSITYTPSGSAWNLGNANAHGRVAPDASKAQDGTWHDTTDDTTPDHDGTTPTFLEVKFQGTGIDVRCIIANNKADPSIPPFTGTKSDYSFFIDDVPQNRDYTHEAGTSGDAFLYNTSVFSTSGLSNGFHTMRALINGGFDVDGAVLMLFDYAVVTSDDGTSGDGSGTTGDGATLDPPPTSTVAQKTITSTPLPTTGAASANPSPSSPASVSQSGITSSGIITNASTSNIAGAFQSQGTTSTGGAAPVQSSASPIVPTPVHKPNLAAIIGGVGGGAALVLLLFLFLWMRRRRLRRRPKPLPLADAFTSSTWDTPSTSGAMSSTVQATHNRASRLPLPAQPERRYLEKTPPSRTTESPSAGISAGSSSDYEMREIGQNLRPEVEHSPPQQRVSVGNASVSATEPPPPYEEN